MEKMSKKNQAKMVARSKQLTQLAVLAMKYRSQLLRMVEAIKRDIGQTLARVGKQKTIPMFLLANCDVESEEFQILIEKTFSRTMPKASSVIGPRRAFAEPEEWLRQAMKDVNALCDYLASFKLVRCPDMPEELAKVRVVERVEIVESM